MMDTRARAHALDVAHPDDRAGADGIAVFEFAVEDIGDDFHIPMPVRAEALAGPDAVLIDDPQRPETHMRRVVIIGERKTMPAVEPIESGMASLFGGTADDHRSFSRLEWIFL